MKAFNALHSATIKPAPKIHPFPFNYALQPKLVFYRKYPFCGISIFKENLYMESML